MRPVLLALILLGLVACGGQGEAPAQPSSKAHKSLFWEVPGDVRGASVLREGALHPKTLTQLYGEAEAAVVGTVTGIAGDTPHEITPVAGAERLEEYLSMTPQYTTFAVRVDRWIKGVATKNQITVTDYGGFGPGGDPVGYTDGDLLLEPGRTYIMLLWRGGEAPFVGQYFRWGEGRGTFDVTKGKVLVLNNPYTSDLEYLEGLTVEELIRQFSR